jgi:hypothetical protein
VSCMAHLPAQESDVEKVIRIAKELDISIEDAAVTCDAFELAFSNEGLRRSIFEIIDQLDNEAAKKGEPFGLILTYAVELGLDGIRVGRYADEIPAGQVVNLTPTDRARILLRIKDNFPTQQYLGPMIVNRPVYEFENEELPEFLRDSEPTDVISKLPSLAKEGWQPLWADGVVCSDKSEIQNRKSQIEWPTGVISKLPSLAKEGWQPLWADGVVCSDESQIPDPKSQIDYGVVRSDSEMKGAAILLGPSSLEPANIAICLGPIRLRFNERFPFLSAAASETLRTGAMSFLSSAGCTAHLPPLAALQAGVPAFQSGLSPPL